MTSEREGERAGASGGNTAVPLDLDWVRETHVDARAIAREADALRAPRTAEPASEQDACVRAISCLDLTTLSGRETPEEIRALCAKARQPLRPAVAASLGATGLRVASVCIYPAHAPVALESLAGSGIPLCCVAGDFPTSRAPLAERVAEARAARSAGADEIDFAISRAHVLRGAWEALYDEVRAFRDACGPLVMKVILATGDLESLGNVARASLVAMMAGADFVKTSTGKERTNATLPVGLAMARAIRGFHERTGREVGLKPAGGIGRAAQALAWLDLVDRELGGRWRRPARFRFGASSLLGDLASRLEALSPSS
jgi:deoxyribose-phosphate aldolase